MGISQASFQIIENYVIVDFTTAKIQQRLLADKKREGNFSGDYGVFTVSLRNKFFLPYRSVGFEGNITYAKKVLLQQDNVLALQVSVSLRDK